ncbi:MAG: hypothetical protein MUE80_03020, partial [Acidobacteria bacterium]|nr:hypothetical protein [Acidobacteriota bacterium]
MTERAKRTTLAALLALACLVPACKNGTETPRAAAAGEGGPTMDVRKELFGRLPDGTAVDIYTLTNKAGLEARIMTYGAILVSLKTPDRAGALADINLGFDTLDGYLGTHPYFGAIIGRYGNRIAKARFILDGAEYRLAVNNNENTLHGGLKGFDKVVWTAEPVRGEKGAGLQLTYLSKDGEEGYPGNLAVTVVYTLTDANALEIRRRFPGQPHPDRRDRARGRDAVRFHGAPCHRRALRRGRGRLRPQFRLEERRRHAGLGGARRGAGERPGHGGLDGPAGHPALHGQLPRRLGRRQGRQGLQEALRLLPRDPALSGFPEPPEFPLDGAAARRDLPLGLALQVQLGPAPLFSGEDLQPVPVR